jgi:hypothetical protein
MPDVRDADTFHNPDPYIPSVLFIRVRARAKSLMERFTTTLERESLDVLGEAMRAVAEPAEFLTRQAEDMAQVPGQLVHQMLEVRTSLMQMLEDEAISPNGLVKLGLDVVEGLQSTLTSIPEWKPQLSDQTLIEYNEHLREVMAARVSLTIVQSNLVIAQLRELASDASAARDQAVESAEAASEAAGTAGTQTLAAHFTDLAILEEKRARFNQLIMVAVLLGTTLITTYLLAHYGASLSRVSLGEAVTKASVSVPVLAIAYYFAREASIHARTAQRARDVEVRLKSLAAYSQELPDKQRVDLRTSFGVSLFTVTTSSGDAKVDENALFKEMFEAVKAMSEAVKAVSSVTPPAIRAEAAAESR